MSKFDKFTIQTTRNCHHVTCSFCVATTWTYNFKIHGRVISQLLDVEPALYSLAARRYAYLESDFCVTREHTTDTSPAPSSFQAKDDDKASWLQEGLFARTSTKRDDGCGEVDKLRLVGH